ncbi:MAG TPA: DeoR/GlpR family DNA-binding transcription regulator [Anaerolineaceae bacterium]|nr:DeoR/GlpR family DNA-binding transcription regulator [Anaerolineaceae bacterium]
MKNSRTINRQDHILHLLEINDSISIRELSKELDVSEWTIRRDVAELHNRQIIDRYHGGIRITNHAKDDLTFKEDSDLFSERNRIGIKAAKFLKEGSNVIIGSGSTVRFVAKALARYDKKLTIYTNSIEVCYELANKINYKVVCTGGNVHGDFFTLDGAITEKLLLSNYFDTGVIGVSGLTIEEGLTIKSQLSALTVSIMIEHSDNLIIVADHSKFGKCYPNRIGDLRSINTIITDSMPPPEFCEFFSKNNIRLILA